jgi:hypothetical protein
MIAMGPGIRENVVIDRPLEPTDLVPTLGARLGFETPFSQGKPAPEVV